MISQQLVFNPIAQNAAIYLGTLQVTVLTNSTQFDMRDLQVRPFNNNIPWWLKLSKSLRLTLAMYQPISFIGLVNGLHHFSFASQVMSHDLTSVDSISFCPACKWGLLSIRTPFYTNAQYVMWTYWFNIDDVLSLNVVTMVVSWLTFAIWCLCFGLLTMSERPNHCLYSGKGGGGGEGSG